VQWRARQRADPRPLALLLLSAALLAWLKFIDLNITMTGQRNNGLEAKAAAHSGVMVALHPEVTQLTPLMKQMTDPEHGYQVQMTGEGGRFNLNWLFTPPDTPDPGKIALFQRYLERRGLNLEQRQHLTDCILDWLSPGNIGRLNGAEDSADYHPPHRGQFLSVQELALVKGAEPLVSQGGWEDDFTIYTDPGLIDLQSASRLILECLPGVGDANADRFLHIRQGPDGVRRHGGRSFFREYGRSDVLPGPHRRPGAATGPVRLCRESAEHRPHQEHRPMRKCLSARGSGCQKMGMQPIILSWKEL